MSTLLMPYNRDSYDELGTRDLLSRVAKCEAELSRACEVLPRVDDEGHSECMFYEELYERAEAWSDELMEQIRQLRDHEAGACAAAQRSDALQTEALMDDDPRRTDDWRPHERDRREHREAAERIRQRIGEAEKVLQDAARTAAQRSGIPRRIGM